MRFQRNIVTFAIALAITIFSATSASAQLGIGAGLNFNDLDDIDAGSSSATLDQSTGYHFGVSLSLGSGPLTVRPGVFYHRIGSYDFAGGEELDLSAVEVPIDLRLTVVPMPLADIFVLAGPVVTFPQSGDFDEAVRDVSLSADIGAGVDIALPGAGISLVPELRYSLGMTDYLSEDFQVGGVNVSPVDDERRVSKLMLRLNVMF